MRQIQQHQFESPQKETSIQFDIYESDSQEGPRYFAFVSDQSAKPDIDLAAHKEWVAEKLAMDCGLGLAGTQIVTQNWEGQCESFEARKVGHEFTAEPNATHGFKNFEIQNVQDVNRSDIESVVEAELPQSPEEQYQEATNLRDAYFKQASERPQFQQEVAQQQEQQP